MPNTKDIYERPKVIVAYGPTGSGKTELFATIPGKKFSYCFEPSTLDTLSGYDVDYLPLLPEFDMSIGRTKHGAIDPSRKGKRGSEPTVYMRFQDHVENWLEGKPDEEGNLMADYAAIGINSLTILQYSTLQRVLFINGRLGMVPELSDYMLVGDTLLRAIGTLIGQFKGTIYIEAHDDLVQDKVSHKVFNKLDLIKNLRREMPRLLTDIFVTSGADDGSKSVYKIQTAPSKEYPAAKNSMGLKLFEDVTLKPNIAREDQGLGMLMKKGGK